MSLILKLIGGSAGPYLFVAIAALAIGGYTWGYIEHLDVKVETGELATVRTNLKQAVTDNTTDQGVITSLQTALDGWKTSATKAAHDQEQMTATLEATAKALRDANEKLATTTEKADNVLPNCAKLEGTDVAGLCPGHAAAERMHAADSLQRPNRAGSDPSPNPPPQ